MAVGCWKPTGNNMSNSPIESCYCCFQPLQYVEHLPHAPGKGLSKAEALREAQILFINESGRQPRTITGTRKNDPGFPGQGRRKRRFYPKPQPNLRSPRLLVAVYLDGELAVKRIQKREKETS